MTEVPTMNEHHQAVPAGFGLENEHPMLSMPFTVRFGEHILEGERISVTHIEVSGYLGEPPAGGRNIGVIRFPFQDFSITLNAELIVQPGTADGEATLMFTNPTGPHLAQLRYILNSFIAGDVITLKGMMAYTGPTLPKAPKAAQTTPLRDRLRSAGVALASLLLAFAAASVVFGRYTTAYEVHPVFIDRDGMAMQATVAGQLTYLNPDAAVGEVAYMVASVTGDVLSFQ
ncbi:MAG: hypothetical protein AAF744_16130, partial [Pseudomonadota bacterium]